MKKVVGVFIIAAGLITHNVYSMARRAVAMGLAAGGGYFALQKHNRASEKKAKKAKRVEEEKADIAASYYHGYLLKALQKHGKCTSEPVFRYGKLRNLPGEDIGFEFCGERLDIFNQEAGQAVDKGQCVTCERALSIPSEDGYPRYKTTDVIIALDNHEQEISDKEVCDEFKKAYMLDVATMVVTGSPLDEMHPDSVTRVRRIEENRFKESGDLSYIVGDQAEADIKARNCVACPYYDYIKTRVSGGTYQDVGAIITGTTDAKVCKLLHSFGGIRELLAKTKKEKDKEPEE